MKKHVVFDFGGVLFRWHPPSLLARLWPHRVATAAQAGPVVAEFFQAYSGDWGAFDQGLIGMDETVRRISERTGWPQAEVAQVAAAVPDELQLLPDTVALIDELKRAGHRLFFLSNMPEPYADHLEQTYPLAEWFEAGVFSGRVKQIKPAAEIFHTALQHFGVHAEHCIFLDDNLPNVEQAQALGWQALLFTNAAELRPALDALLAPRSLD